MRKPDPERVDKENPRWTDAMFVKAKPAAEVFPDLPRDASVGSAVRRRNRARQPCRCGSIRKFWPYIRLPAAVGNRV
jgi:hypothetical protein